MKYTIYCDGSARNNGGANAVGAWAFVILDENGRKIMEGVDAEVGATNQQMELRAAIEALNAIDGMIDFPYDSVTIYTDSAYLHNCYKQNWYIGWRANGWRNAKKQPVANKELWEQLIPFFERWEFDFAKVKGHAGGRGSHEMWNEYVDNIAQTASKELSKRS